MDWPQSLLQSPQVVTSYDQGYSIGGLASASWPANNLAIYMPFRIFNPLLVKKLWWFNGTTATGNVDVGIYTADGTRIVSTGSTAASGANAVQEVDITDFLLPPGQYYFGLARSTTANIFGSATGIWAVRAAGLAQEASALPLPAVATFAAMTGTTFFMCGLSTRVTF